MEIKIHNLKKTYGSKTAVDIPDYTLQGPEILGLMGNNGDRHLLYHLIHHTLQIYLNFLKLFHEFLE